MTSWVLLYHHVAPRPSSPFTVSPESLRAQTTWLIERDFQLLTLCDFWSEHAAGRKAFITFDDGYTDVYQYAFPVLRACHVAASVFLITDYIGQYNRWEYTGRPRYRHLDHAQIGEMCASGWEMHSHTASHAHFGKLSAQEIGTDVQRATWTIRRWNQGPLFCAFPYGRSEPRLIKALQEQGYAGAFVAEPSWPVSDPYRLPRTPVLEKGHVSFQSLFPEGIR
jgi:peptidoglycan/xylan/chitin deacetylase (PgdA/CDA1 family)